MLNAIIFLCFAAVATAQQQFVWDLLKPALNAAQVQVLLANRDTDQYPTYNTIPQTGFSCASKKQPGFYADTEAQCQVFHRCDINGIHSSYLCANTTVFNQVTLVCDYFFNVDCQRFSLYENLANSRLYTNQPLFDTSPADYVSAASQTLAPQPVAAARTVPKKPSEKKGVVYIPIIG